MRNARSAMGAHHDQVDFPRRRMIHDRTQRIANDDEGLGFERRVVVVGQQSLQPVSSLGLEVVQEILRRRHVGLRRHRDVRVRHDVHQMQRCIERPRERPCVIERSL
jgi:hypothetical protein